MKIKNKGKVHPSPSSSSSSSSSSMTTTTAAFVLNGERDVFSVLKLLPAAILALASVLSLDDREVLAYMIARSIKTTTNPSSFLHDSKKKPTRKQQSNNSNNGGGGSSHKAGAVFDCDCFDCYTSYWVRWDSSPNRELIHQAIEAFEDHLTNGERSRKNNRGGKRRDKTARRLRDKQVADLETPPPETDEPFVVDHHASVAVSISLPASPDDDVSPVSTPASAVDGEIEEEEAAVAEMVVADEQVVEIEEERSLVVRSPVPPACSSHKGLARKVLPDVMGLLNSRLWSLWSPNV